MKSRYKKHLKRITRRSPIVAFSIEEICQNGDILIKEFFTNFSEYLGLDDTEVFPTNYQSMKQEMYMNLIMFTDNYLVCGPHRYVYILLPLLDGTYKVIEKESLLEWSNAYWEKEDPNNERDWCYMDEDINDLMDYLFNKLDKHIKKLIHIK